MTIKNGFKNNLADIASFLFVIVGLLNNPIKELSATHFFRHEVIVRGFVKDIIEADNVRMEEILENGDFILEGNFVFLSQLGLCDNLNGKRLAGLFVRSVLDDGKGAFSELTTQSNTVIVGNA
jgi:hypothetical protein